MNKKVILLEKIFHLDLTLPLDFNQKILYTNVESLSLSFLGRRPALLGVDPLPEGIDRADFLSFCLVCLRKGYKNAASYGLAEKKEQQEKEL